MERAPRPGAGRHANSGLGWQLAETLAAKGATVVMGCRDAARAAQAADAIRRLHPDARVEVDPLDLADLASIARRSRALRPTSPNAMAASTSSATTPA